MFGESHPLAVGFSWFHLVLKHFGSYPPTKKNANGNRIRLAPGNLYVIIVFFSKGVLENPGSTWGKHGFPHVFFSAVGVTTDSWGQVRSLPAAEYAQRSDLGPAPTWLRSAGNGAGESGISCHFYIFL